MRTGLFTWYFNRNGVNHQANSCSFSFALLYEPQNTPLSVCASTSVGQTGIQPSDRSSNHHAQTQRHALPMDTGEGGAWDLIYQMSI